MNIQIYVEHDIIIRHFVLSRVFEGLIEHGHDVTLVLPNNAPNRVKYELGVEDTALPIKLLNIDPKRVFWWKRLFLLEKYRFRFGRAARALKRTYTMGMGWKGNLLLHALNLPIVRQLYVRHCLRNLKAGEKN